MFAEKIGESSSTTGTGAFAMGGAYNAFRTWRSGFADGDTAFYLATNDTGTIWEIGYGTFATGTPDTLSRVLLASSSGSLINWATTPYRLYSIPTATALKHMLAPLATARPAWLPAGSLWLDYALGIAVAWVKNRWTGAADIEEGRFHITEGIYTPSPRRRSTAVGAASKAVVASDLGARFTLDNSAADRTVTLPPIATAGLGFAIDLLGLSTAHNIILAVDAGDTGVPIDFGANGASLTLPGQRWISVWSDGTQWRTNYVAPALTVFAPGTIHGLTYQNNGSDAANDIDIAAGGCMDATGAYWIVVSAITKRLDAAWAVGSGNGGLDTGSIADGDYYIWAIARSDTGVTDALFSLSSTTPTMPANYDYKRLIGWLKRADGAITAFHTYEAEGGGLDFAWDSPTLEVNLSSTLGNSRRTDAMKVPLTFPVVADLNVRIFDPGTNFAAYIWCPDRTDVAPSGTAAPLATVSNISGQSANHAFTMQVRTSASGLIAARATSTVSLYAVSTLGFRWSRR